MDLHPNWRALATIHLPLKHFVREGAENLDAGRKDAVSESYQIKGVGGLEAQKFYKQIVSTQPTSRPHCETLKTTVLTSKPKTLLPFDKNKFFRYAMSNNLEELKKMHITSANMNACDSYGWTALMMAACEGAERVVEWLCKLGTNKTIVDKSGNTASHLARKKGHLNIVAILERKQNSNLIADDESEKETKTNSPFYCEICQRSFSETSQREHFTSTVHQFNEKAKLPANKLQRYNISVKNIGLQLMVKQGWDREHGLGPTNNGRLYPVKTVLRKNRTGLGVKQPPARVTHFSAFNTRATQRRKVPIERRRTRSDMQREKRCEWRRNRRLRNELN